MNPLIIVANQALFMEHLTGDFHPESPQRIEAIEARLREAHLMDRENTVQPRVATTEEISLCHDEAYQEELQKQILRLQKLRIRGAAFDSSTCRVEHVAGDFQISPKTLVAASFAAGAPLTAIEFILNEKNEAKRAFCIIRPPGHHAHRRTGSGFCVFNNVAIAAKHLTCNLGFRRVLIVDWDGHHGDGTQELTESDGKIFYFSTHRDTFAGHGFYPGSYWGRIEQTGLGEGKGTVLNCPVFGSNQECRKQILEAFKDRLIPAMDVYRPEFILISCGFDAHQEDPLVGLGLKDADYGELTLICKSIAEKYAKGRMVSVLEGGYNLDAIARAAQAHVEAMM